MCEQSSLSGSSSSESLVRAFRKVAIRDEKVLDQVEVPLVVPTPWEAGGVLEELLEVK